MLRSEVLYPHHNIEYLLLRRQGAGLPLWEIQRFERSKMVSDAGVSSQFVISDTPSTDLLLF